MTVRLIAPDPTAQVRRGCDREQCDGCDAGPEATLASASDADAI